jgi:hypothetical protein
VEPYLTMMLRHDPIYQASPPYQALMAWMAQESIPHDSGWRLVVWDEQPIRAVVDVIETDPDTGEWVINPDSGQPVTHEATFLAATLPPVHDALL